MDDGEVAPSSTLAAEIAAELELTLPQAADRLAEKLRESQRLQAELARLGLVRPLPVPEHDTTIRDVTGIAASGTTLPAFGGLLYGVGVHAHNMQMQAHTVLGASEQVRVHIGDLDFYESGQRVRWKLGQHLFGLLGELLDADPQPRIILLDLPIFVSRGEEGNRELIEEVQEEWLAMVDTINTFWREHAAQLYPLNPAGATLATVQTHNASPLFVALHNNPLTSPDAVDPTLPAVIRVEWKRLRQAGMARLLDRALGPQTRTIAYAFEDLQLDPRWQPQELHHSGVLGFFMRAGPQTPIWQVQVPGHRTQWTTEALDQLAVSICQTTLGVGKHAEPLPLWYARRLASFPHSILEVFREMAAERMEGGDAGDGREGQNTSDFAADADREKLTRNE